MDPNTPLTIAAARYKTRPEAVEAFETCWGAHHQDLFDHMALAVLTKDEHGQLEVERHDTTTKHLAWGGLAIGAALAVVCPPAGIAAVAVAGGAGRGQARPAAPAARCQRRAAHRIDPRPPALSRVTQYGAMHACLSRAMLRAQNAGAR